MPIPEPPPLPPPPPEVVAAANKADAPVKNDAPAKNDAQAAPAPVDQTAAPAAPAPVAPTAAGGAGQPGGNTAPASSAAIAAQIIAITPTLAEMSDAKSTNDASGILERVAGHASAIASQLRRFQTYAQVEQAYAKMQATIGEDLLPDTVTSTDLNSLTAVIAARLDAWGKGGVLPKVETPSAPIAVQVPAPVTPAPVAVVDPPKAGTTEDNPFPAILRFLEDGFKTPAVGGAEPVASPDQITALAPELGH